jgi:hypothetical protein
MRHWASVAVVAVTACLSEPPRPVTTFGLHDAVVIADLDQDGSEDVAVWGHDDGDAADGSDACVYIYFGGALAEPLRISLQFEAAPSDTPSPVKWTEPLGVQLQPKSDPPRVLTYLGHDVTPPTDGTIERYPYLAGYRVQSRTVTEEMYSGMPVEQAVGGYVDTDTSVFVLDRAAPATGEEVLTGDERSLWRWAPELVSSVGPTRLAGGFTSGLEPDPLVQGVNAIGSRLIPNSEVLYAVTEGDGYLVNGSDGSSAIDLTRDGSAIANAPSCGSGVPRTVRFAIEEYGDDAVATCGETTTLEITETDGDMETHTAYLQLQGSGTVARRDITDFALGQVDGDALGSADIVSIERGALDVYLNPALDFSGANTVQMPPSVSATLDDDTADLLAVGRFGGGVAEAGSSAAPPMQILVFSREHPTHAPGCFELGSGRTTLESCP